MWMQFDAGSRRNGRRAAVGGVLMLLAAAVGLPAPLQAQGGQAAQGSEQAPEPGRLAAAKDLMQAIGLDKQFEQALPLLAGQMRQSFISVVPDKAKEIEAVFEFLLPRLTSRRAQLLDKIAELYARKLSEDDLRTAASFYRSPAGARFIAMQPELMREGMVLGQRWGEAIGRELEEEVKIELKKRGVDL